MISITSSKELAVIGKACRFVGAALFAGLLLTNAHAAPTALANEPFTSSSQIKALPNVMFVLDDSGSMKGDFLPDWAGPYQSMIDGVLTTVTPAHRFFNNAYNGVAYDPGTRYQPPVMYNSDGSRDLTTYPSQTGQSAGSGGDGSATAASPNWRAVKVDGYGIQSTATANLEGNAFSYVTVPGEYCDSAQLRNCIASAGPSGAYTFPAKLRWCNTSLQSVDTPANAGTNCQASNIEPAAGLVDYTFARMPRPHTATITLPIGSSVTVTHIVVGTAEILSASAGGSSSTDLATAVVQQINACTFLKPAGSNCTVVGYSAVSVDNVVTVTAPAATNATPALTGGGAATVTPFSNGNVGGSSLLTVITPTIARLYPRGANRSDCTSADIAAVPASGSTAASPFVAGTTCTFAEEMTNYANWYAYSRTRMQMMKTASSIAFSNVDDKFRVGFYSINNGVNGAGSFFINPDAFAGAQKYLWYSKFLSAVPYGATPLRAGLATMGRLYAGKLNQQTLNHVTVSEPMQYSCQQNFTILSTDGYWNDANPPVQIDGATQIGEQDGNLDRPYYDGAKQSKTVSQTMESSEQSWKYEYFVESKTTQLQTSTSRLTQTVTTTTYEPWEIQTSQLQTRTKTLTKDSYNLESRTYPLQSTTNVLRENTFNAQSTTRPLEKSTFMLTETTTPLTKTVTKIISKTYALQNNTQQTYAKTTPLQKGTQATQATTTPVQQLVQGTIATTTPLQTGTQATYATTTPVQRWTQATLATTTPLQKGTQATYATTTPVQQGTQATYATTTPVQRWTQATLATTTPLQKGTQATSATTTPVQSLTQATLATTTPLQKGTQATQATTTPVQQGTRAIYATISPLQSSTYYLRSTNYQLQKRASVSTDGGDTYQDTGWVNVTSGNCTVHAGSRPEAEINVTCRYRSAGSDTGQTSCASHAESTGPVYTQLIANSCAYEATPTVAAVAAGSSCTVISQPNYVVDHYEPSVTCAYGTAVGPAPAATCVAHNETGTSPMSGDKVVCSLDPTTVWATVTGATPSCTPATENYAAGGARISCRYDPVVADTTTSASACVANDQTGSLGTLGASIGPKVVCSVAATPTWANSPTCSAANPVYASGTAQISCRYDPVVADTTTTAGTCAANDQSASLGTLGLVTPNSGDKVVCSLDTTATWTTVTGATPTCTPTAAIYATGVAKVSCRYDPVLADASTNAGNCTANDQTGFLSTLGVSIAPKVVCSVAATPTWVTVGGATPTCVPANPIYATGTAQVSCRYDPVVANTTTAAGTCSANDQSASLLTLGASISGNKVVCSLDTTTTWTTVTGATPTCTPTAENYGTGVAKVSCRYDPVLADASTNAGTCAANDQTAALGTLGASIAPKVVCSVAPTPTWVTVGGATPTCTPANPVYATATAQISCRYDPVLADASTSAGTCAANDQTAALGTLGASIAPKVVCSVAPTATWVNSPTCSAANPVYASGTAQISCRYDPVVANTTTTAGTCAANDQSASLATLGLVTPNSGNKVVCSLDTTTTWTTVTGATPTCTPTAENYATGVAKVSCRYDPVLADASTSAGTCAANDQTAALGTLGTSIAPKVVCSVAPTPTWINSPTCTPTNPVYATGVAQLSCRYDATHATPSPTGTMCVPHDQSGLLTTIGALITGDQVLCSVDPTATWATVGGVNPTCTPTAANYAAGTAQVSCRYDPVVADTTTAAGTCTANDQTAALGTLGVAIKPKVVCSVVATPTWVNSPNCSAANPDYAAGTAQVSCRYDPVVADTTTSAGGVICAANDQSASLATLGLVTPNSGDKVVCVLGAVNWVDVGGATPACTPATANYSTGASQVSCRYNPVADGTKTLTDQSICAPHSEATTGAMTGNQVTCAYQGTTTATTETSCQWTSSATAATQQVTCAYNASANSQSGAVPGCSTVAQATATTEGTTWNAAKACAYRAAVVDTNQPTCTHSGSQSSGPDYASYVTCGYGTGSVATGLPSCLDKPAEGGPDYSNGSTVVCAYPTTATSVSTDANRSSCTPIDASSNFAPKVTCSYDAASTTQHVATCTNIPQSSSGTYAGPATVCSYGPETVAARNLNAPFCTPNRQSSGTYNNDAVDCTYNGTATTTSVTSCSDVDNSGSAYYAGPKTVCHEGAAYGTWANVTAGTCVTAGQSGPPNYTQWRDCQYTPLTVQGHSNVCNEVAASGPPNYSVLIPVHCVAGSYLTQTTTTSGTVDYCSTDPTQVGDTGSHQEQVNTTTTCTPASPTIANATSCTEKLFELSSPFTTQVKCTSALTSDWAQIAGACTPVGTPSLASTPAATIPAEFVGGINVGCRTTDVTGTPSAFVKTPSCVPSTAAALQRQCSLLTIDAWHAVDPTSCVATIGDPPGPDYVKTLCQTTVTDPVDVAGCVSTAPVADNWQTVTCTDIAGTGSTNTLADVAAYYYYTDLRTSALGNCVGAPVPPATTGNTLCSALDDALPLVATAPDQPISVYNNVRTSSSDPEKIQHMVTFTLGLGASGYMKYVDKYASPPQGDYATVFGNDPHQALLGQGAIAADPANGVCSWQAAGSGACNWPYPVSDQQTTVDDLWHAGVNGHGAYFSATDPKSLSNSISGALAGVAAAGGASASPTISNPSLSPADNYIFSSTYKSGEWTGELTRRQLDPYTGVLATTIDWAAQAKLDAKAVGGRVIYTFDAGGATHLKAFTSANFAANSNFQTPHIATAPDGLSQFLCTSPDTCLSAELQSSAVGANLVNYLRGDRSNEGALDDNTTLYRQRQHVFGDMVNAQTVYVNQPVFNYADPGYSNFVAAQTALPRQAMVYAGANDGMLHAFAAKGNVATENKVDAAAAASSQAFLDPTPANQSAAAAAKADAQTALATDALIGQELWAYIPSMVLPNLYKLADKDYKDKHRYFVDATPLVGDICISSCNNAASANWRTILVGGLGHGGRGYYALDITTPGNPTALWEFTDTNLGYSYGNPQIAKLRDGTWVVLLTSGYNNIPNEDGSGGDGKGYLYVINAATGALIRTLSTGNGSATDPSGLTRITAQVINPPSDNTIEAVYGGDLHGNLWRFDIDNVVGAPGYDAQLLATLKDGAGNTQPITTKPEVGLIPHVNVKVVFVGTGRFLDSDDVNDVSQQSLYAIKDVRSTGTNPAEAIFDNPGGTGVPRTGGLKSTGFVGQVQSEIDCPTATLASICAQGSKVRVSTNNPVDFATENGWFVDLLGPDLDGKSERANTDPTLALGLLAFNTNAPSLAACDLGGKSYEYFINYLTGGPIYSAGNGDPGLNNGVVGKLLAGEFASAPVLVVTKGGKLLEISGLSGSGIVVSEPPLPPEVSLTRRTGWRELTRD